MLFDDSVLSVVVDLIQKVSLAAQNDGNTMMTATSKFTLGAYVYNPNSTDPTSEAWFENQFNNLTEALGTNPRFMDAFTNYYADWSQWVPTEDALALSWSVSPVLGGVTPVMTIPMATISDWSNSDQVFRDIVAGKHDDVFTGLVNSWKAAGYTTIEARIGDEMNANFVPWSMGNNSANVADWVAAFQHIADLVHAIPDITVKTVWNPVSINWTARPTASAYPGDQYVDVIGVDVYSTVYPVELYDWSKNDGTVDKTLQQWFSDPVNREHYWMNPNATEWNPAGNDGSQWGVKQALALAKAHNKPLALAETGAGGNGTSTGPVDDPDFPKWLAGQLSQPGAPQVAFVNIWDINPGDGNWQFTDGSKPQELAAWQQYFGVPQQIDNIRTSTVPNVDRGTNTVMPKVTFVDSHDARFSTAITSIATAEFGSWSTGLNNNIYQWTEPKGVIGIGASTFDAVQVANLADDYGDSFRLNNFDEADVMLSGGLSTPGSTSTLEVDNAMRGTIAFGSGNYASTINVLSASAAPSLNRFQISMGPGIDSLTLDGDASRTFAAVTTGSGTDKIAFVNVLSVSVTGGAGTATISLGNGAGTVTAGSGSLHVTGGTHADTYVANVGIGLMVIENFLLDKGDALQIDKSLQGLLVERRQTAGLMLSFGGDTTHGVMLSGVTTLLPNDITWV